MSYSTSVHSTRLYEQSEGKACSDLGRVLVLDDPPARFLTVEHKVTAPAERERLARDHGVVLGEGVTRLYGLALARALGDSFLKQQVGWCRLKLGWRQVDRA
jgi:hypothetical protein